MNFQPGFHNVQPNQRCRIVTIQLAIPADAEINDAYDEIFVFPSGAAASDDSNILNWRYPTQYVPEVTASIEPVEGEIFTSIFEASPSKRKRTLGLCTGRGYPNQ